MAKDAERNGDKSPRQSDTPRTDALVSEQIYKAGRGEGDPGTDYVELEDLARQLERELAEARESEKMLSLSLKEEIEARVPSQEPSILYERRQELDKRIKNGDDFAGDAWVRYTAVGHIPESFAQSPLATTGEPNVGRLHDGLRDESKSPGVGEIAEACRKVASAAWWALDASEEGGEGVTIPSEEAITLQAALDALDELPEVPHYSATGPAKAEHWLAAALSHRATPQHDPLMAELPGLGGTDALRKD